MKLVVAFAVVASGCGEEPAVDEDLAAMEGIYGLDAWVDDDGCDGSAVSALEQGPYSGLVVRVRPDMPEPHAHIMGCSLTEPADDQVRLCAVLLGPDSIEVTGDEYSFYNGSRDELEPGGDCWSNRAYRWVSAFPIGTNTWEQVVTYLCWVDRAGTIAIEWERSTGVSSSEASGPPPRDEFTCESISGVNATRIP